MHVAILLVLITAELVRRKTTENASLSVQSMAAEALLESIQERRDSEESIRSLRHDLKNHVISMQLLLEQGDTTALAAYLNTLRDETAAPVTGFQTGNELLDGLLRRKLSPIKEQNIRIEVSLDFYAGSFMEPFDLCVLMGNILDNAVEACLRMDPMRERFIRLSGGKTANCLLIRLENSYDGENIPNGGILPTSKTDKRLHGFGLRNVRRVVDHYHGTMTISVEDGCFAISLLLPIPDFE